MISALRKGGRRRTLLASAVVLTATVTGVALSTSASTASTGASPTNASSPWPLSGLKILLTNDDSMQATSAIANGAYDGGGLYVLRHALCAAGADVVVVAPWGNQSGAGTAFTSSGSLTLTPPATLPSQSGLYDSSDCASAPSHGALVGVCVSSVHLRAGDPERDAYRHRPDGTSLRRRTAG